MMRTIRIIAFSSLFQLRFMRKEGQTPSHKIRIEVTGLISVNHVATFTLPDMVTPPGETTLQTNPLEGSPVVIEEIDKGTQVGRF